MIPICKTMIACQQLICEMSPARWEVDTFHHQLVDALGVGASIVNTSG